MTVVRQEVSNFDRLVVVHELELAINRALYGRLYVMSEEELWRDHSKILIRSSKVGKMILFGSVIVVYVPNPTAVWLVPIYFDPYIGSSYMIQVVFCPYVCVKEQYSMIVVEFLL